MRPLTARSVVLSVLLGAHPPELPVRHLVRVAQLLDISDTTVRVAVTRMVAAGDLHRAGSTYRLSERLVARQRRQDEAIHPQTVPWDGRWELVAVTGTGRTAADRGSLRARLAGCRLAELRPGLWLRPANLLRTWPTDLAEFVERFVASPDRDGRELARTLWDLDSWDGAATGLLEQFGAAQSPADRFALAAAIVRTLLTDPVLPAELLGPHPSPAPALRAAYRSYQDELIELLNPTRGGPRDAHEAHSGVSAPGRGC